MGWPSGVKNGSRVRPDWNRKLPVSTPAFLPISLTFPLRSFPHPINIERTDDTFRVSRSGTYVRFTQPLNIASIVVTLRVFNAGAVVNAAQLRNMLLMTVTLLVSISGALANEEHSANMRRMLVMLEVLKTSGPSRSFAQEAKRPSSDLSFAFRASILNGIFSTVW